jgi:O-antigen/teichoic acid export membrane protein
MNVKQVLSAVRTLGTIGGTVLVSKGYVDAGTWGQVVGAVIVLWAFTWSMVTHSTMPDTTGI